MDPAEHAHHTNGIPYSSFGIGYRRCNGAQANPVLAIFNGITAFPRSSHISLDLLRGGVGMGGVGDRLAAAHLPHSILIPRQEHLALGSTVQRHTGAGR